MKYQTYPAYKDSGVEWLGEVPEHWEVKSIKYLAELNPSKSEMALKKDLMCHFVPMEKLKTGTVLLDEIKIISDVYDGYTYFKNDDILLAKVTPCFENHNIAIVSELENNIGFGSTEIYVLRVKVDVVNKFLFYRLQESNFMAVATSVMTGAGGLKRVPSDFLTNYLSATPVFEEQQKIANFLDHETAKIDTLIEKQRRLIELLKEKRQAVISHAVTKGLNPNAPMKDSGVEWLGDVPEHWVVSRIKNVVTEIVDGPHFSPSYRDDGYMFISARNIKVERWALEDAKYISEKDFIEFSKRVRPMKGDVLLTKGGTTGVARAVDFDFPFQVWVHVAVLKIIESKVNPFFLAFTLNGTACYEQSQLYTRGATNNDLGLSRIANIFFVMPPKKEQDELVLWIEEKCKTFDELIKKGFESIELMQERRTALISAAVTGKIDVRHWQGESA